MEVLFRTSTQVLHLGSWHGCVPAGPERDWWVLFALGFVWTRRLRKLAGLWYEAIGREKTSCSRSFMLRIGKAAFTRTEKFGH